MRHPLRPFALAIVWLVLLAARPSPAAAGCPTAIWDLVDRADRITRGNSSEGIMAMTVYKRGTVSMRMRVWSKGRDKFLAKILGPSQLKGNATLKSGDHLWNYLPRLDRVVQLGSSMMGGSWMGSHFTNDDLVKETDFRVHYACQAYREEGGQVIVTATPKANAPVVWGKQITRIIKATAIPVSTEFYDERGTLKRTMRFEDVRAMGGRTIPARMVLQPADAPSERTVFTLSKMKFDVGIPDSTFTLQGLKR
jgi:outer membrane lipoprotein-sorting protein